MTRHRWVKLIADFGHTTSECSRCYMRRVQRHAVNHHWTEWKHPDGTYIESARTPPCFVEQPK